MNLEKIMIFVYNLFPLIKKYKIKKIKNFLEPIGLSEILSEIYNLPKTEQIRMLKSSNDKNYVEGFEKFKEVIEKNFDSDSLHNFYYNSEWVKVNKVYFMPSRIYTGTYDYVNNKLKFKKSSLYHELFHMCSTDFNSIFITTGFSLDLNKKCIGEALSEGYTDLLTKRYFNEDISDSYWLESRFALHLEKIIGKKTMEELYMKGDFFGFISELNKYYKISEIETFLINLDIIGLYYSKNLIEEEADQINMLIEDCICFLIKGFCKILKNKNYSMDIKKILIEEYFYDIQIFYKCLNKEYEFDFEKINKVIKDNLSNEAIIDFEKDELLKNIK